MGNNDKGSSTGNSSNGGENLSAVLHFPIPDPEQVARDRIRYRKPDGDTDVTISQEELARERALSRRASTTLRELKQHREGLLWRFLEYGPGNVDPGALTMDAILIHTEPKVSKGSTYYRLLVK